MTTALDLITTSFIQMGVYGIGETLDSGDASFGLARLNDLMDSWSNEALFCFAYLNQSGPLVPGQAQYTIGTTGGADFAITRPIRLGTKPGTAYVQDGQGNNYPMQVIQQDRWNLIWNRVITNSNFPDTLFYDPQFPLGILNVYPEPNSPYTMFWDSLLPLTEFPTLTTTLSLPPGYAKAIQDNLSVFLWMSYKQAAPPLPMQREAAMSKAAVKRTNKREVLALYDPEITAAAMANLYNIYSDSYGVRGGY